MNIISLIQLCVSLVLLAIGFFIFRLSMADRRELLAKTSAADKTAAYNQELLRWLELKTMGKSIAGCLEEKKIKKLSIYGAGDIGKFLKNEVETHGFTVHYMIDSNPDKLDDLSFHCPVVLPSARDDYGDAIVIAVLRDSDRKIKTNLRELGIHADIYTLRDLIGHALVSG